LNDNEAIPSSSPPRRQPWNKGSLIGAKRPLRASQVWSIQTKLQLEKSTRDLQLFNLTIDSKPRGCDVVAVRVDDVALMAIHSIEQRSGRRRPGCPVRFELIEQTYKPLTVSQTDPQQAWRVPVHGSRYGRGLTTRQYARLSLCGSQASASIRSSSARTPCAEPKRC
jgi:hypothetical protein